MKKKNVADSSFLGTKGRDSHNKENRGVGVAMVVTGDVVVEEIVKILHKVMEGQEHDQVLLLWKIWTLCGRLPQQGAWWGGGKD